MTDKTNLTELAAFFPATGQAQPTKVTAVAPRFVQPGDTYEQSLARQRENFARIEQQANRRAYMAGLSRSARKAQYDDL